MHEAAMREIKAAAKGQSPRHSSGHKYKMYRARRKWLIFWEVYEVAS